MATRPVLIPDMTWKGVGPNATQKDLKRKGKFPNYKSPGLLLKNLRNGMYGLLCEFGKWLWNCGETFFVIVESLWFFFRNSSDFFRNSSGQFRNRSDLTLWRGHWGASGNPWNMFENWELASETDDMLPDAIPRNTQCQGLTRLSRTWSVYHLCMLPSFWAGHVGVMLIVCMFFSHPYLSLSDWLGYVPPLLWNLGPGVCAGPSFKSFLGSGKF